MNSNVERDLVELIWRSPSWQALAEAMTELLEDAEMAGAASTGGLLENTVSDGVSRWLRKWAGGGVPEGRADP